MEKKILTYSHTGKGYNPYLIDKDWQVAQLNYVEGQGFHDLVKVDQHLKTDEAFILNKGTAVLIGAEVEGDKVTFEVENMKQGVLYNIPKGVWHNIGLSLDAEVFIVENSNTHLSDFVFHYLTDEQIQELKDKIDSVLQ